jgi:hypothetical protein
MDDEHNRITNHYFYLQQLSDRFGRIRPLPLPLRRHEPDQQRASLLRLLVSEHSVVVLTTRNVVSPSTAMYTHHHHRHGVAAYVVNLISMVSPPGVRC